MSRNMKTIVFVLILGTAFSLVLMSIQALTAERIEMNQRFAVQSAILDAFEETYTIANFADVFDETMETVEIDDLVIYVHEETGGVAFEFSGFGVWGPIRGIIAFESDFETILYVRVLEQEETPGLGGVVAEESYLDNYVGASMADGLVVTHNADPNLDNEVDAITGATRTSESFQSILNNTYEEHKTAWDNREGGD